MREIVMPKSSMTMTEGDLLAWHVEEGDVVREGDPIAEIMTDKVAMDVEAPADGRIAIVAMPGQTLEVGTLIGLVLEGGEERPAEVPAGTPAAPVADAPAAPVAEAPAAVAPALVAAVRASPAGRAMARRLGVDLTMVDGTGPRGRIQPEDIEAAAARVDVPHHVERPASDGQPASNGAGGAGGLRRYRPTGVRAAMALQMERALAVPQFCLFADMPFVGLERTRKRLAGRLGTRIGVTDVLVRAVAVALRDHPALNAHWVDGEILEHRGVNVGIAADTPTGLVVPVLAGADRLSIADVAARSTALLAAARAGILRAEDVADGTFTISNLGMMGITVFQPVVNPPQVAILSVGAGRGDAGRSTTLGLAADHRAIDGAQAARFLQTLRDVIETADAAVIAGD